MKEKFMRFMYGRYGNDSFGRFLSYVYLALVAVNLFLRSYILSFFIFLLFGYWIFRVFSRNTTARHAENMKYTAIKNKFLQFFKLMGNRFKYRKTHVYRKCTTCKSVLKLPKVKGSHTVKCPNCLNEFEINI